MLLLALIPVSMAWPTCHLQGSLPAEHGGSSRLPPNPYAEPTMQLGRFAGMEPTMTISTKAAFDAINRMFKVGRSRGCCAVNVSLRALQPG